MDRASFRTMAELNLKTGPAECHSYRERVYRGYLSAGEDAAAPLDPAGLRPRAALFRRIIRDFFPEDRGVSILDLGCGHGAFIHFMREAGYGRLSGVDRSPQQVAAAKEMGIEGVRQGDLFETLRALPADSKDLLIAFDVIEHFRKHELLFLIDEAIRVLKPGGRWIIHAPNGESPFCGAVLYGDFTHELAFTCDSLRQLLLASGFGEVACHEDRPCSKTLKGFIRRLSWLGCRTLFRIFLAAETGSMGAGRVFSRNLLAVAYKPEAGK